MKNEESPHTLGFKQVILHSSFYILHFTTTLRPWWI